MISGMADAHRAPAAYPVMNNDTASITNVVAVTTPRWRQRAYCWAKRDDRWRGDHVSFGFVEVRQSLTLRLASRRLRTKLSVVWLRRSRQVAPLRQAPGFRPRQPARAPEETTSKPLEHIMPVAAAAAIRRGKTNKVDARRHTDCPRRRLRPQEPAPASLRPRMSRWAKRPGGVMSRAVRASRTWRRLARCCRRRLLRRLPGEQGEQAENRGRRDASSPLLFSVVR